MNNSNMNNTNDEINLRELFKIIIRKKWLLIGLFLFIFLAGMLLTYLIPQDYRSTSDIRVSEGITILNDDTYNLFFPAESKNLWLFPVLDYWVNIDRVDSKIAKDLLSPEILKKVSKNLNKGIDYKELEKDITVSIITKDKILTITSDYKDPQIAHDINEVLLQVYSDELKNTFNANINDLLKKINDKSTTLMNEIKSLSADAEKYVMDLNIKLLKEKESNNLNSLYSPQIDFLNPVLKNEIDTRTAVYNRLIMAVNSLTTTKDFYLNRIEIIDGPNVPDSSINASHFRNTILSFFAALIISLIVVFAVNYFQGSKKEKK
jgi:uncharacterized protein involved in exopolysaccharide biosynthesis